MRRFPFAALSLLLAVCLTATGCLEKTEKVTLNPDGTGKREFELLITPQAPMDLTNNPNKKPAPSPDEQMKTVVQKMVDSSVGIEAWKDLKYELAKDGRFHVTGVAYFKDFNSGALVTNIGGGTSPTWRKEGDAMVLDCSIKPKQKPRKTPPATEAEVDQKVAQAKMQWAQMKPMLTGILSKMRDDVTYVLPGKVSETGAFESKGEGVRLVIEGPKMLDAMDLAMSDEAAMRDAIKRGVEAMDEPPSEAVQKVIFGRPGTPIAKVTGPMKPAFDYGAESAAAKSAMPEMLKTLGLTAPSAPKSPAPASATPAPAASPAPAK